MKEKNDNEERLFLVECKEYIDKILYKNFDRVINNEDIQIVK